MVSDHTAPALHQAYRTADGWLFAHWLLSASAFDKLDRLSAGLAAAAQLCRAQSATGTPPKPAADWICAAWAADLASRLLRQWKGGLQPAPPATAANRSVENTDPPVWEEAPGFCVEGLDPLALWLERIGLAAFWVGSPREGAALINGSATLVGGAWFGAMSEAAVWRAFGHGDQADEVLRCAARTLPAVRSGSAQTLER